MLKLKYSQKGDNHVISRCFDLRRLDDDAPDDDSAVNLNKMNKTKTKRRPTNKKVSINGMISDDSSHSLQIAEPTDLDQSKIQFIESFKITKAKSECEICGKKVVNLRMHKAVHSSDRPFECSICHKTYRWSKNLHEHERIHMKTTPTKT